MAHDPKPWRPELGPYYQDRPDLAEKGCPIDPVTGRAIIPGYRKRENARRNRSTSDTARDVEFPLD